MGKRIPHRITVDSPVYGYDQFDYESYKDALAGLIRLVNKAHTLDDDGERAYTIQPLE